MSNTNGFHPPSASMAHNGQNDISKRLPSTSSTSSTSSNSTTATTKRLKAKLVVSTVNETRSMKGHKNKKQKTRNESNKKRLNHSDSNNNQTKKVTQSTSHSRHIFPHPIIHHHQKQSSSHTNQFDNIPSSSSATTIKTDHHIHHHHHVINNDHCDSCGELYGEMISCDTCPATFHLLCANPPLSREDVPKGSYFCENCRAKAAEEETTNKDKQTKTILHTQKSFSFDPKNKLHINGFKKNPQRHTTLGQIKLPTASNGRSLVQPSGEIKFRATNNTNKAKLLSSSSSNLKRKRIDSSSSPPSATSSNIVHPVKIPTIQIEALRRLLISCRPEEFRGPSLPFDDPTYNRDSHFQKNSLTWQKYCFICRKASINPGPSLNCDYCPLTYHLDCLTPPMTSLPSSTDKWMCPNHIEPILDRYLLRKKNFSTSERVKIYRQYSQIEHNTIIQEFTHMRQTKNYLTKTINNHKLERIEISQIPKVIEQFYLNANPQHKQICDDEIHNDLEVEDEECVQTSIPSNESSSAYDRCVWDVLQAILHHINDDQIYEFSDKVDCSIAIENDKMIRSSLDKESNVLDTIDTLLNALNEPNYSLEQNKRNTDGLAALVAAADSCLNDENSSLLPKQIPPSLTNSLSLLIDLSQFRLSHAALIHTRSKHVIYIRKHVIWFGSSILNDICLRNFNDHQTCQYISERHTCLYYDRKRNLFELLNYSEYGTIVNGLRYGLGSFSDDESDNDNDENEEKIIENENLQKCFCLTSPSYHSAWDGPAQIEQGTVVQIGCHEFIFYRHVVR